MGILTKIYSVIKKPVSAEETLRNRGVKIGKNFHIYNSDIDGSFGYLCTIGDNVTVTNACILYHDASTKIPLGKSKVGRVNIGSNVFIAYHSVILPNVNIGNNVIIGAGSVVSKDIPDNSVAAGNPAKVICTYDEYVNKHRENMKTAPVFDTYWENKTDEQKKEQYDILDGKIGYDE